MHPKSLRAIVVAAGSLLAAGRAEAVSQIALEQADWEIANAQVTAPVHVQIRLDGIELNDRGTGGPQPCTIRGTVERSFRGALALGQPVVLHESCIVRESGLIGAIEYGFYYQTLVQAGHMEVFLAADGGRILGHAGWVTKGPSDTPQHPAPASLPPQPRANAADQSIGTIRGQTRIVPPK